jgi:protein-tyrosine phosphatase
MFTKIRHNLYLSGVKDITASNIAASGVTSIVCLTDEVKPPKMNGVALYLIAFKDCSEEAIKFTDQAVDTVSQLLSAGETVLVCCRKGASRSPHIVASTISSLENKDYDASYGEVRELHPRAMAYSIGAEIRDKHGGWVGNIRRQS